jgi:hypothetical protein
MKHTKAGKRQRAAAVACTDLFGDAVIWSPGLLLETTRYADRHHDPSR